MIGVISVVGAIGVFCTCWHIDVKIRIKIKIKIKIKSFHPLRVRVTFVSAESDSRDSANALHFALDCAIALAGKQIPQDVRDDN